MRSNRVGTEVLYDWINAAIADAHRLITEINPHYIRRYKLLSIVSGENEYPYPPDFSDGLGVDIQLESGTWANMRPYRWADRNRYQSSTSSRGATRYQFADQFIEFQPTPTFSGTDIVKIHFAPVAQQLDNSNPGVSDVWDTRKGFDEFVIKWVQIELDSLENRDPTVHYDQLKNLRKDMISQLRSKDRSEPPRTRDVYRERDQEWDYEG